MPLAEIRGTPPDVIPHVQWGEFLDQWRWHQGEHLTAIGPTRSGKSTLVRELLKEARVRGTHPYQVMFKTKRKDDTLDEFERQGFVKLPSWIVSDPDLYPKVMLAPPLNGIGQVENQRKEFQYALDSIFRQGGWLAYADEFKHLADFLKLAKHWELLIHQGASSGITTVQSLQRPKHVPLMAYDQAVHLFFWESRDSNIQKRLSEIGGRVNPIVIAEGVESLEGHRFLYVNTMTGQTLISEVEL